VNNPSISNRRAAAGRTTHRHRISAILTAFAVAAAVTAVGAGTPVGAQTTTTVAVTEVAPWGSGIGSTTGYAADWFEVTNLGPTAVNITGWKMDDNSNAFANSVALNGITSIAAGESVIFMETSNATVVSTFRTAWSVAPTVQIGTYTGSGVGLSASGDAVNLFTSAGAVVTGVTFGASTAAAPFASFENATGQGSTTLPGPIITTFSAISVNGAYASADSIGVGSPGTNPAGVGPDPVIPEFPAGGVLLAMLAGLGLVVLVVRRRQVSAA